MNMNFEFASPRQIVCQKDACAQLKTYCDSLTIKRPMIVTDPGLVATGIIEQVLNKLKDDGLTPLLYSDIEADPPEQLILDVVSYAQANNVDGVIGLGGGSSMDAAKLVAVLTNSAQSINEIYGVGLVSGARLPLILIPTTAGTGSEVTPISIVTTGETTKAGIVSPQLIPDIAILDAELTLALPAHVTAATGIDAMVHAIEAYTSKLKKNPYSDMLARQALSLMAANLEESVANGQNIEAREHMLFGAMLDGQAFANAPVAAVHALAYPLGGNYHIPHGLSNSLVLPHVLAFNAPSAWELYAELLPCVTNSKVIKSSEQAADLFISFMIDLIDRVNLPSRLSEVGVPRSDLDMLASEAMQQQRLLVNNPREMTVDAALMIYEAAF